ncbi:hypothetical protein CsSME_00042416 [Camellia sinensis var. sinensis]
MNLVMGITKKSVIYVSLLVYLVDFMQLSNGTSDCTCLVQYVEDMGQHLKTNILDFWYSFLWKIISFCLLQILIIKYKFAETTLYCRLNLGNTAYIGRRRLMPLLWLWMAAYTMRRSEQSVVERS